MRQLVLQQVALGRFALPRGYRPRDGARQTFASPQVGANSAAVQMLTIELLDDLNLAFDLDHPFEHHPNKIAYSRPLTDTPFCIAVRLKGDHITIELQVHP